MHFSRRLIALILLSAPCFAQTAQPQDQQDPEDRNHGVARISLLNGDVAVRRGDSGDAVAAAANAPLLVQDAVQTGPASRAEVQFDTATRLRLGENTDVRLAELVAGRYQIQIARGTTTLSIQREGTAEVEIDTPSVAVRPSRAGDYRVSVLDDGTTQITVRQGETRVNSGRGEERVMAGQTMLARGSADNPEFQIIAALGRDEWDTFNERRDRELERTDSYRYVGRDVVGAEDLDSYGQWQNDPTYGQVWEPRVAAGWAPYRSGRWVWEDYYGWTWVSYDPWGWAPYHYGNWFVGPRGWAWYPGSIYGRHFFRPALVGFFGFGAGVGVGFGFANIGWVPLAPFELFHAWWGRGFRSGFGAGYGGVGVLSAYRNARFAGGVTAMGARDFADGRFGRFSSVGQNELRSASLVRGGLPVTPGSGSLRFNDRQTSLAGRTTFASVNRFASHNQPALTQRTPFRQQQNSGGFGRSGASPAGGGPGSASSGASGWQRFGSPSSQGSGMGAARPQSSLARSGSTQSAQPQGNGASGWGRFGSPSASGMASGRNSFSSPQQSGNPGYRSPAPEARSFSQPSARSVQVAPPMVRERSAPSYSGATGGRQSAPSYHSAPAPSSHSNSGHSGSGGSSHSSSSGGGHHGR